MHIDYNGDGIRQPEHKEAYDDNCTLQETWSINFSDKLSAQHNQYTNLSCFIGQIGDGFYDKETNTMEFLYGLAVYKDSNSECPTYAPDIDKCYEVASELQNDTCVRVTVKCDENGDVPERFDDTPYLQEVFDNIEKIDSSIFTLPKYQQEY